MCGGGIGAAPGLCMIAVGLLIVLQVYCYRKSLETAIAIIDATADFFMATKRVIAVSFMYFALSIVVALVCVISLIAIGSLGDFTKGAGNQEKVYTSDPNGGIFMLITTFVFLWILMGIDHTNKYICMVSACTYYFDSNAARDGNASVCTGFKFAYLKNAGSICMGSFIMTVITILRTMAEIIDGREGGAGCNPCKCITCWLACCLRCVERFVEYLTKNAYAYQAVTGETFCTAGWNGMLLNLKYCAKFYFAHALAAIFINIGIFLVVLINMGIAFILFMYVTQENDESELSAGPIFPFLTFFVGSYFIAKICLGLFDEGVVAFLQCYSIDTDLHDGATMYGPKSYHEKLAAIEDLDKDDDNGGDAGKAVMMAGAV